MFHRLYCMSSPRPNRPRGEPTRDLVSANRRLMSMLGAAIAFSAAAGAADPEWPCWRGPNRDGRSPDIGLLKQWPEDGPPLVWKADGIGHGFATVSIGWGTIYTTGDVGGKLRLSAFGLDGRPKWQVDHDDAWAVPTPGSRATPTLHDGKLYLLSAHGLLGCRSATDGRLLWSRRMSEFGGKTPQWGYTESVLIHNAKAVVTPGGKQCIVALDPDTGETLWTSRGFDIPAEYGSCIAIERQPLTLLVGVTSGGLVGVRAANGQNLWPLNLTGGGSQDTSTPVFAADHVFWAGGYGRGATCIKIADNGSPTVAWTTGKDSSWQLGDFVIDRGHVYGHLDRHWMCLDLETGEEKWTEKGIGPGSITWADGMLYLFSERRGEAALAICTPEGFQLRGRFRVAGTGKSWAHPVVSGGRLYLRYDTTLYCFDIRSQQPFHKAAKPVAP